MIKPLEKNRLLTTLWAFVLFNMIFRDLHQFLAPGFIDSLNELKVSEPTALFYGVILELPILMLLLSNLLPPWGNRIANCAVSLIIGGGITFTLFSADLDDLFFGVMKLLALVAIFLIALKGPETVPMRNH